jgi:hypothetical protein
MGLQVRLRRLQMRRLQMRLERLLGLWRLRRLLRILGTLPLVLEPAHFPTSLTEPSTNGRVLLDPAKFYLLAPWTVWDCKSASRIVAGVPARPSTGSTTVGAQARPQCYPNPRNIVSRW